MADRVTGIIDPIVMPFTETGEPDFDLLLNFADDSITAGCSALFILGSAGQGPTMTPEERQAKGIKPLPGSLGEASALAEGSELLLEALGDHILNSFLQNKAMEWNEYRATVTDYETARYLPIL